MGVAGSPDIIQEKYLGLMSILEFVRTYVDNLLIILQESFKDHLEKLEAALKKLQDAGLKINAAKSTVEVHKWRISWVCPNPRRNKTSKKEDRGNPRN